jgi:hypothetical protein
VIGTAQLTFQAAKAMYTQTMKFEEKNAHAMIQTPELRLMGHHEGGLLLGW